MGCVHACGAAWTLTYCRLVVRYPYLWQAYEVLDHHKLGLSFKEWIGYAATWRRLAEKCAAYGLFAFADDLVQRGALHDPTFASSPHFLLFYARICVHCSRRDEAKQALSVSTELQLCSLRHVCGHTG